MRNLKSILADNLGVNLNGWQLKYATGVSADGMTIVGYGTNPDGNTEGWIATIPEPCTLALLIFGSSMLRKRKSKCRKCTASLRS